MIEDAELEREEIWFQHDGAPAHNAMQARDVLDEAFPGAWIGRGGPIAWPATSPDLNILDYFFWGHLQQSVYKEVINNVEDLRAAIGHAIETITPEMLERAQENPIRRAHLCIQQGGGHFEHLL